MIYCKKFYRANLLLVTAICSLALPDLALAETDTATQDAIPDAVRQKMHAALKERWYTTEVIVYRAKKPPPNESLLLSGEHISAKEQRALQQAANAIPNSGPNAVLEAAAALEGIEDTEDMAEDAMSDEAKEEANSDADSEDETDRRPELDAEPWEDIKEYGANDDLGELVARNMATWEEQLRARDGSWLNEDELNLADEAKKLARSRSYEVLLHGGWTQAVPPRGEGHPITVAAGDTYLEPRTGEPHTRLEGEVVVTLGRYLHVKPTLYYTPQRAETEAFAASQPPAEPFQERFQDRRSQQRTDAFGGPEVRDLSSAAPTTGTERATERPARRSALDRLRDRENADRYADERRPDFEQEYLPYVRLDQSRRVRSSELHYIDHPELRMLVIVTPVVAPELLQEQFALLQ